MKNKRSIALLLTFCTIVVSTTAVSVSVEAKGSATGGERLQAYYEEVEQENDSSSNDLGTQAMYLENAIVQYSEDGTKLYPAYYGGMYIEDGQLVVAMTGSATEEDYDNVRCYTENADIIFKTVEYSYMELYEVYHNLKLPGNKAEFLEENADNEVACGVIRAIQSVVLNEAENSIEFRISEEYSEAELKYFYEYFGDNDMFTFEMCVLKNDTVSATEELAEVAQEQDAKITRESRVMKPGDRIYIYNTTSNTFSTMLSIGYRAQMTAGSAGLTGFVTAGHGTLLGYEVYSANVKSTNYYLGYIYSRKYANNSTVDASFVYSDTSSYAYGNTTKYANRTLISNASVEEGKTVFIEGASSATVVSGTVSDNSANYYSADSYLIKDAIEIDCEANSGDSGGIAYVNNGGTYNAVGICAAIDTTYGYTYVIKADNIKSELNVTFY